jgi:uncharacterized protein (DUF3820 family)
MSQPEVYNDNTIMPFGKHEGKKLANVPGPYLMWLYDNGLKLFTLKNNKMIQLTDEQRNKLNKLWFIYGNNGKKHSHSNHRFIQNILSRGEDDRKFYLDGINNMREKGYSEDKIQADALTQECINAVDEILKS